MVPERALGGEAVRTGIWGEKLSLPWERSLQPQVHLQVGWGDMKQSIHSIGKCCEQIAINCICLKESHGQSTFHKMLVHRQVQIHFKQYFLQPIQRKIVCMLIAFKVSCQNNGYFIRTKKMHTIISSFPRLWLLQGLKRERDASRSTLPLWI